MDDLQSQVLVAHAEQGGDPLPGIAPHPKLQDVTGKPLESEAISRHAPARSDLIQLIFQVFEEMLLFAIALAVRLEDFGGGAGWRSRRKTPMGPKPSKKLWARADAETIGGEYNVPSAAQCESLTWRRLLLIPIPQTMGLLEWRAPTERQTQIPFGNDNQWQSRGLRDD